MKKAILFLEPMNHIMKVIESAHSSGLEPIVIHQLPIQTAEPYGHASSLIAESCQISSWTDEQKLDDIFTQLNSNYEIVGTYAAAEITLLFEAKVRQQLNLPTNSAETIKSILDKEKVRKKLLQQGLSDLTYYDQNQSMNLESWPEGFRAFVKPTHGAGSANVYQCSNWQDFQDALEQYQSKNYSSFPILNDYMLQSDRFFMEQAAEGELMSLECITFNGKTTPIGITSRSILASNPEVEMGACFPYPHKFQQEIIDKVIKIHETLGFQHGASHTEIIVSETGKVELVELNPRFIGADMIMVINAALNTKFEDVLLKLSRGINPTVDMVDRDNFASIQYVLPCEDLESFDEITFPEDGVCFTRLSQKLGASVSAHKSQFGHLGGFITMDKDYEELLTKVKNNRRLVKVNGKTLGNHANNEVLVF